MIVPDHAIIPARGCNGGLPFLTRKPVRTTRASVRTFVGCIFRVAGNLAYECFATAVADLLAVLVAVLVLPKLA